MPLLISDARFAAIVAASGLSAREVDERLGAYIAEMRDEDTAGAYWLENASPELIASVICGLEEDER